MSSPPCSPQTAFAPLQDDVELSSYQTSVATALPELRREMSVGSDHQHRSPLLSRQTVQGSESANHSTQDDTFGIPNALLDPTGDGLVKRLLQKVEHTIAKVEQMGDSLDALEDQCAEIDNRLNSVESAITEIER